MKIKCLINDELLKYDLKNPSSKYFTSKEFIWEVWESLVYQSGIRKLGIGNLFQIIVLFVIAGSKFADKFLNIQHG